MFANGLGSISGWVISKTQKMVLNESLLNTLYYKVWIKGKWSNPGKEVVSSSTPWCSSYWKGSLWVAFDYCQPTFLLRQKYINVCKKVPVSNGYHSRKWTRWYKFKSWTRLIAFHIVLIPLGKVWIQLFSLQLWVNSRADWFLQPWCGN